MPNALAVVLRLSSQRLLSSIQLPKTLNERLCRTLLGVGINVLRRFLSIPLLTASHLEEGSS
jgi:hypothetical protein